MNEIIPYKCLKIYTPTPSGDAGRMINDNFIIIADAIENAVLSGISGTSGASGTSVNSESIPQPRILLDSTTLSKVHFLNRPSGSSVLVYKYTKNRAGQHIKGVMRSRTYTAYAASTTSVDIEDIPGSYAIPMPIDGVTFTGSDVGKMILFKDQGNTSNHLYFITGTADGLVIVTPTNFQLEKSSTFITNGTANANTTWLCTDEVTRTFVELVQSGRTTYSNRIGKRYRLVSNVGEIDDWDAAGLYVNMGKVKSYMFAYSINDTQGPMSTRMILMDGVKWRF